MAGEIGGKTLHGEIHVGRPSPQTWSLDRLVFRLGSCTIDGRTAVDTGTLLAEGTLKIGAENLDDLSAVTLAPMAGSLNAVFTLTHEGSRQNAVVRAHAVGLRRGDFRVAQLDADLTGRDLRQHPIVEGFLNVDGLAAAGETLDSVRLRAQRTPGGSDMSLKVEGRGLGFEGIARLVPADRIRIEVSQLLAFRGPERLALPRAAK
jgi:translocation and assembly module TamB